MLGGAAAARRGYCGSTGPSWPATRLPQLVSCAVVTTGSSAAAPCATVSSSPFVAAFAPVSRSTKVRDTVKVEPSSGTAFKPARLSAPSTSVQPTPVPKPVKPLSNV